MPAAPAPAGPATTRPLTPARKAPVMPNHTPENASNVLALIVRVAGPVITGVHAVEQAEQVSVRLGDVLVYLDDATAAARLRQQWDTTRYLATRLPEQVSQTWLAHDPKRYPVAASMRLDAGARVGAHWISARRETRTPAHLRVQVDRLVWQVCDLVAWDAISAALFEAERLTRRE